MAELATQNETKQNIAPSPKLISSFPETTENSNANNKKHPMSTATKTRNESITNDPKFNFHIIFFRLWLIAHQNIGSAGVPAKPPFQRSNRFGLILTSMNAAKLSEIL